MRLSAEDGRGYDTDRVMFLRACLGQFQRTTAEGVPVDGCLLWFREAARQNAVV